MKDLQNLLNQVAIITKKNAEFLDATGSRFNIFRITGVNHLENKHSAILAALLNPKGTHGLKEKFLKAFCDGIVLKEEIKGFDFESAVVKTESPTDDGGRIDILIEDKNRFAIVIENKIYANDQDSQLKRYHTHASKYYSENFQIFYLTLDGKKASENSGGGIKYKSISYAEDVKIWLDKCVNLSARFPFVRETIGQYINLIKQLTNQDITMNKSELVELLSKPENLEAAFTIAENISSIKFDLVKKMAESIAQECGVKYEVSQDGFGIGFFKEVWEKKAGIWFAEDKGNTYYAIKNADARNGKADLQNQIAELFNQKPIPHDPFGYGYVYHEHWKNNKQLYVQIADGSFGREYILPNLRNVLEYLSKNPEIEGKLKKG